MNGLSQIAVEIKDSNVSAPEWVNLWFKKDGRSYVGCRSYPSEKAALAASIEHIRDVKENRGGQRIPTLSWGSLYHAGLQQFIATTGEIWYGMRIHDLSHVIQIPRLAK
jgi:hypothetical protein